MPKIVNFLSKDKWGDRLSGEIDDAGMKNKRSKAVVLLRPGLIPESTV